MAPQAPVAEERSGAASFVYQGVTYIEVQGFYLRPLLSLKHFFQLFQSMMNEEVYVSTLKL